MNTVCLSCGSRMWLRRSALGRRGRDAWRWEFSPCCGLPRPERSAVELLAESRREAAAESGVAGAGL